MLKKIKECFKKGRLYYSGHARIEMEVEELGEIREHEVYEAVLSGKIIENYPNDEPYPSCLIYGKNYENRPLEHYRFVIHCRSGFQPDGTLADAANVCRDAIPTYRTILLTNR